MKTYMDARPTTSMKNGWLCRTSCDEKNWEIAPVMMTQWWSRSSDDLDLVMMIRIKWWSRSSDDLDLDEDEIKMKMTWIWRWQEVDDDSDDIEKKTCANKLCQENTFLVKRECWCNCNFGMYSLVFLIYCNPIFIPKCTWVMSCPDVPIGRFYNVNKSCEVIVGNPPIDQGLNSPQLWGPRVIILS